MKKVYVVSEGYDYEGSNVVAVYLSKEDAKLDLEDWKKQMMKDYDYNEDSIEKMPFGFKFGTHYRIAEEFDLKETQK